jgi:mono/diheme cytochrome c family protein
MRILLPILFALAALAPAHAQTTAPTRGALLYGTHCVECHTTQMHWREQRLARDFASLKGQVRRFQGVAGLAWSDEDIDAVARHLNDTVYRFPEPQARR